LVKVDEENNKIIEENLTSISPQNIFYKVLFEKSLHKEYLIVYSTIHEADDLLELLLTSLKNSSPENGNLVRKRVSKFLFQWVKVNWPDFRKNLNEMKFSKLLETIKNYLPYSFCQKLNMQIEKLKLEDNNRIIMNTEIDPRDDLSCCLLTKFSNSEIAKFLYIMDSSLLSLLEPSEFLKGAFTKKEKHILAPNVTRLTNWFNHIVSFVRTTIFLQDQICDRVKVIIRWIEIAMILVSIENYSSVIQIMTAINHSLLLLKSTKEELKSKIEVWKPYEYLSSLSSVEDRTNLKKLMTEQSAIPYLGLYLAQIVRLQETIIDDPVKGTINFYQRQRIASIVLLIQQRNFKHQKTFSDSLQPELKEMELSYIFLHSILIPEESIPRNIEKPPGRPKTLPPVKSPKRKSKAKVKSSIYSPLSPTYNVTPENSSPRLLSANISPSTLSPNTLSPNISPHWSPRYSPRKTPVNSDSSQSIYSEHNNSDTIKNRIERTQKNEIS